MILPPEFQFINKYFKQLSGPEALGLTDDAALLSLKPDEELVLTADAMTENVHFFKNDPVDLIARKLLRCNLSDIAAMGAKPFGYLLTLSLPSYCFTHTWFEQFTKGLGIDQNLYKISLLGGDTTKNLQNMNFSVTMLGKVKRGQALRRNTAKAGDGIWVTGTIGDAALGLLSLNNKITYNQYLINRYHLPQPRVELMMTQIASAAMDISDGLIQDLGHLTRESKVSAVIFADQIPLSFEVQELDHNYFETCITGGDDYELILTIPEAKEHQAIKKAKQSKIKLTKIGYCVDDHDHRVKLLDAYGYEIKLAQHGWSHI